MKKILFTLLSSIIIFSSCHNENMNLKVDHTGEVRLSSLSLTYNTDPVVTDSRAAEDMNEYVIGVYTKEDALVQEWKYSDMPEVFALPVGTYKILAHSPEVEGAQFDAPYCYGESKLFEIIKNNVVDAGEVKCTLKSIKVTIKFDDKLKELISEGGVDVSVGEEKLTFGKDETRSGFFHGKGESNTIDVLFNATVEGEQVTRHSSYSGISEGTELILNYSLKESVDVDEGEGAEYVSTNLKISDEYKKIGVDGTFTPGLDEIPDVDELMIKGQGFDINEPITDLTQDVVVNLNAPKGMKDVYVKIESTNENFIGAVKAVFKGKLEFSLLDEGLQSELSGLGFPTKDDIVGKKQVKFDISQFVGLLGDETFAGVHKFNIKITDMVDETAEATLTIDSSKSE